MCSQQLFIRILLQQLHDKSVLVLGTYNSYSKNAQQECTIRMRYQLSSCTLVCLKRSKLCASAQTQATLLFCQREAFVP